MSTSTDDDETRHQPGSVGEVRKLSRGIYVGLKQGVWRARMGSLGLVGTGSTMRSALSDLCDQAEARLRSLPPEALFSDDALGIVWNEERRTYKPTAPVAYQQNCPRCGDPYDALPCKPCGWNGEPRRRR